MKSKRSESTNWWGQFQIPINSWANWRIGPMNLYARPTHTEWRFAWRIEGGPLEKNLSLELPAKTEPEKDAFEISRFSLQGVDGLLQMTPRLGDRDFVFRSETRLYLLSAQETTLYVSTPVWISLAVNKGKQVLLDIPTFRPSDTWFGPNTREGELCYASLSSARTSVEQLSLAPHRAITPIQISNRSTDSLLVEQLRVPVTALAVYVGDNSELWSDAVVFEREQDEKAAFLRVREKSTVVGPRELVAKPRSPLDKRTLVQAFSRFFRTN